MLYLTILCQFLTIGLYGLVVARPQADTGPESTLPSITQGAIPAKLPGKYPSLDTRPGFELVENKAYNNLTIMDVLNNVKGLSSFASLVNASEKFKSYLSDRSKRYTIFATNNSRFKLADKWQEAVKNPDGLNNLEHMLAYHVASKDSYDFGSWPKHTQSFLATSALFRDNTPKSLIIHMEPRRMMVNCAIVASYSINVSNGIVYIIDKLLDPWLEAPSVEDYSKNQKPIACKALMDKVKT
ncbi:hypothetical protein BDF19DRAFT_420485 [Syncephalis fuscata]|nr:hypothetical protein BDF19DRAFT_420485 [Syncephalis fuscata]